MCATKYVGAALYFIWVCLFFFVFAGQFPLFPAAVTNAFGLENAGLNMGVFLTAMVCAYR
jgi:hypothetical protein